jgi:hypothetical protein
MSPFLQQPLLLCAAQAIVKSQAEDLEARLRDSRALVERVNGAPK